MTGEPAAAGELVLAADRDLDAVADAVVLLARRSRGCA
jgi:hypothetical protein